jgi:anaerobic dimethyl sulfoxide reductase subunit A
MKQMKEKYGPFFLLNPYGSTTAGADTVFAAFEAGCMGYGLCTDDVGRLNGPFSGLSSFAFGNAPCNDAPDGLKYTKLWISAGRNHYTNHWGGSAFAAGWYKRMAREKGCQVIALDSKYSTDVEICADQWIPIKPGTDNALFLAMAQVILSEGLYDKAWTDTYMYGFQQQADYILGNGGKGVSDWDPGDLGRSARLGFNGFDGWPDKPYVEYSKIAKTPEWAEKICGVPAETIRELARLYAKTKPARLERHAGTTRKSYGEYTLKTVWFLNIITGNAPGVHGGCDGSGSSGNPRNRTGISYGSLPSAKPPPTATGSSAVLYAAPTFYRAFHWWKTVAYALKVQRGEPSIMWKDRKMTWQEWGTIVGFNADPAFLTMFNPKMLWGNASNCIVMGENTNAQIRAMTDPAIEFSFHQHTRITATGQYTDMIVPLVDYTFENTAFSSAGYGSFDKLNVLTAVQKPPGEAWPYDKTDCAILEKIGGLDMAHRYWSGYNGIATFEQDYEKFKANGWAKNGTAWLQSKGATAPTWDEIKLADKGHGVIDFHPAEYFPSIDTCTGGPDQKELNCSITTKTGKVELFHNALADPSTRYKEHFDFRGVKYAHMPNDWKDLQPISVYHPTFNGLEGFPVGRASSYPLYLLTSKSRYAIHYLMGDPGNPRIRDVKRHALWISAADAKARGIKDNDVVRIYNEQGQVAVRAYVTNRCMPGVVLLHTGNRPNYISATQRIDVNLGPETLSGGATNQFTGGDDVSPVTPAKVTNSVQVELLNKEEWF